MSYSVRIISKNYKKIEVIRNYGVDAIWRI